MITCEDVLREVSNYLDSEVTDDLRHKIELHIGNCHNCTVLVSSLQETVNLVSSTGILELPRGVSLRLRERLNLLCN